MAQENKTYQIGKQILTEDDLMIPVEYKGEVFTLRYPTPSQRAAIELEVARRLGGMDRGAYSVEQITLVTVCTYVDNLIVSDKSPAWFVSAWTCMDEELTATLYAGYLSFRDGIQQKLREDGYARGGKGGGT